MQNATPLDVLLFVVFPYLAVALAVFVGVMRYFNDRFSFSSLSSQFLENRTLFWGSVPWHYGIILVLTAHLLAAVFPTQWGNLISDQTRLYVLEVTGLALALMAILGLTLLIVRRITNARKPLWIRTPVVPGYTDDHANIEAIARFIREELPTVERWDLLAYTNLGKPKYHRLDLPYALENAPLYTRDEMESVWRVGVEIAPVARWSGATR